MQLNLYVTIVAKNTEENVHYGGTKITNAVSKLDSHVNTVTTKPSKKFYCNDT